MQGSRTTSSTSAVRPARLDNSKSPIVIGYVNQQGGANDVGPNSTIGAQMAADYVNKYAGGIGGHPVKLHTCFISTSEEQGQQCGQKMANDKAVDAVGVGAVATGAQPLNASIAGEKPMFWGVSVNQVDTKNKNGFILFGDSFHILAPWGTFGRDVLKAKTAAVVYPQVPGIIEGANAMVAGLEKAGIKVKRVGYEPNATDLVGPLTAAGAQSADMIVPQSDAKGCINLAKALEQTGVKAPVVSNPLCLSPVVSKGLGGDVPKWYYGIASSLTADQTDPAAKAMVDAMTKLGKADLAADPWVPTSMATVLTMIKFMNEVGADKLTPAAIADKAKVFKGPLVFGAPQVQCAKYPTRRRSATTRRSSSTTAARASSRTRPASCARPSDLGGRLEQRQDGLIRHGSDHPVRCSGWAPAPSSPGSGSASS